MIGMIFSPYLALGICQISIMPTSYINSEVIQTYWLIHDRETDYEHPCCNSNLAPRSFQMRIGSRAHPEGAGIAGFSDLLEVE
jgi:hypothetical protein